MKGTIVRIALTFLVSQACQSKARVAESEALALEGVIEKIGVAPGVGSGVYAVYQFAKYRVTSVCEGEYDQQEIVVDHLILRGNELDSLSSR